MEGCFLEWVKAIAKLTKNEVVSIDGKSICGSRDKGSKSIIHMVSAWANVNHMVLGQVKVDEKSNEITAIPKLLDVLELKDCIVTIDDFSHIEDPSKWQGLKAIVKIEAERYHKSTGQTQKETRLYITSCTGSAKMVSSAIRAHWGVENSLHWVLDVSFGEDASRKKDGHSAQNFSLLNRIALNLVKNEKSKKRSVKGSRVGTGNFTPSLSQSLETNLFL